MTNKVEHVPYIALVAVVAIVGVVVLLQQAGNDTLSSEKVLVGEAVKIVAGSSCDNDADCPADLVCDWNLTSVLSYVRTSNPATKLCLPKSSLGELCASRTLGGGPTPAALFDWECQPGLICVRSPAYANPTCQNQGTLAVGDSCLRDLQCQSGLCLVTGTGRMVCS